jgi:iron(III) transport system substrate-binding protein
MRSFNAGDSARPPRVVTDAEGNKSVGIVQRLRAESARPIADVVWMGEPTRLRELCERGALTSPTSALPSNSPPSRVQRCYAEFAGRARVLLASPDPAPAPTSVTDLVNSPWRGRAAVANPHFGTTSAHFAALYARWGDARFREFVRAMKANGVQVLPGNAQVKDAVAQGRVAWGVTDSDDARAAILDGAPVTMIIPDQQTDLGVMIIPNTVSLVVNSPNPAGGRAVAAHLLSAEVEARLAQSRSGNIPLRHDVPGPPGFPPLQELNVMAVDMEAVMDALPRMLRAWDDEWARAP